MPVYFAGGNCDRQTSLTHRACEQQGILNTSSPSTVCVSGSKVVHQPYLSRCLVLARSGTLAASETAFGQADPGSARPQLQIHKELGLSRASWFLSPLPCRNPSRVTLYSDGSLKVPLLKCCKYFWDFVVPNLGALQTTALCYFLMVHQTAG